VIDRFWYAAHCAFATEVEGFDMKSVTSQGKILAGTTAGVIAGCGLVVVFGIAGAAQFLRDAGWGFPLFMALSGAALALYSLFEGRRRLRAPQPAPRSLQKPRHTKPQRRI